MDALQNVFVGEVLNLQCHESGNCQEPDDRYSDRSRGGSELLQSAGSNQNAHVFRSRFFAANLKLSTKTFH